MENKLKNTLMIINQKLKKAKELEERYRHPPQLYAFWQGRRQAFEESAQLIKHILNSENPNSVSNQPTEE